jgi:hypothetical protein
LLGRQLRLEPIEDRAGSEGIGRGELVVTDREREDHGCPLPFGRIFGEAGADPAEREELERDRLLVARPLECLAEALTRLGGVSQRA